MSSVARLSIAPVASLGLEHPTEIDVTERGVVEDRRFYLTDANGRFVDRTVVGRLVQVAAHTDPGATMLRLTLPDGTVIEDEVRLGDAIETQIYGRTAAGHVVTGPWGAALEPIAERPITVVRGDMPGRTRSHPTSLLSDGSLRELARHAGVDAVDARRFRMLIDLEGAEPHEEDTWIGRRIALGDAILRVIKPDARCAITTQDPDTGTRDLDTLRTLIAYRGLRDGKHADFGVLADVVQPGRIRVGDEVAVLDAVSSTDPAADRAVGSAPAG